MAIIPLYGVVEGSQNSFNKEVKVVPAPTTVHVGLR